MRINSIDFPDDLVESLQNKELVIFAGAGVSMGDPTCLPDFAKLTRAIAKDTRHKLGRRKDYEVFLGELKDNFGSGDGPNVNKLAADILEKKCKSPNRLHKAIINLFEQSTDIKIVTTNYDQMLETAARDMGVSMPVFDAPALPLGNDISGVVHLHGNVNNHKYIVLTDEDFGKAYLTDGYASRFLVQLFTQYDVLFIGYSLNDTVLHYLAKAMSRVSQRNKYILTDKDKNKYKSIGIIPIPYPEGEHEEMTQAIEALGERVRMNMIQWKEFFEDIKTNPPKDTTKESIVSYCLKDYDKTRIMMQIISGELWIAALNDKGVFDNLFKKDVSLTREDELWIGWLSKNIICANEDTFFDLLAKHKSSLHIKFAEALVCNIISNEKAIADDVLKKQVILLSEYISEDYMLHVLLDIAHKRNLIELYWFLYKKMFTVKMLCEKRMLLSEYTVVTHKMSMDAYSLSRYWKQCENDLVELFSLQIIRFCVDFVESLHNEYVLIGEADSQKEPWRVSNVPLEDRDVSYFFDGLYVISDIFLSATLKAQENNPVFLKGVLSECLTSDSVFLRKMALISLRETNVFTYNQKLKQIIENGFLLSQAEIQQTKRLVGSIFDHLNSEKQSLLLNEIEKISTEDSFEGYRIVYSYLNSIKKVCSPCHYVDDRIALLDAKYDYSSFFKPTPPIVDKRFHMNAKDITELSSEDLKEFFTFVCSNSNAFYIHELMDELTKASEMDFEWTYNAIKMLKELQIKDKSLWTNMLYGVRKTDISIEHYYALLKLIANPLVDKDITKEIADVMLNMLRLKDSDKFFLDHEDELYSIFLELWKHKQLEQSCIDILQQSLNSSLGILINCCIIMIDMHKGRYIPEQYKSILLECLSMKGQEYYVSLCVIGGHYNYFHYRDAAWCNSVFNPMLSGDMTNEEYVYSWDGFVLFSGGLNVDTVDDLSKVLLRATEKMALLSNDAHNRFIDLYITLLIHVIKRPGANYIPRFFSNATDEDKRYFVSVLGHRLEKMESEKKMKLWNRWLKRHLENRTNNKPIKPIELELQEYLEWLPHLQEVYDEAVEIMCNSLLPKKIGLLFFDELIKSDLPNSKPESTCKLLISLCENGSKPEWSDGSVKKIRDMMYVLPPKDLQALDNALVKNGWY